MLIVNRHSVAGLLRVEGTDGLSFLEAYLAVANPAPEWQARGVVREQGIGGDVSTRRAC